ncbi:MAG: hypothetical protein KAV01_09805, partial [Candidatus Lokiarchaeota archaeon]|nr:hypothetical protein [Candidatus Lokiarchaeota archaeon]
MTENEKIKSETQEEKSKEELDKEKEEKLKKESLQKAGKIAQKVKEYIKPKIKVGAKVFDLISDTEAKIEELDGLCAFPVNL